MAETIEARDDAPLASSKRKDAVRDATETLIEGKGDALTGRAVTINRPVAELYAYWRDFTNLPAFMDNVVSVLPLDDRRSHWVVKAPGGGYTPPSFPRSTKESSWP